MKLSLTAIAALSAAFFHPTVATGTRAASSNGNTNAAEDKPNRNRDLIIDNGNLVAFFEGLDEAIDSKVETVGLAYLADKSLGFYSTWMFSDCLVRSLGTQDELGVWSIPSVNIIAWAETTPSPDDWLWLVEGSKLVAGKDGLIGVWEMFTVLKAIPETTLKQHMNLMMPALCGGFK